MADSKLTDPVGREIVLHERTWVAHIVKGHPDIAQHRELVELAVRKPRKIWFSRSDPACRIYYGSGPRTSVMIMVIADVDAGVVKTAHLAKEITGASEEWSSQTP